MATLIVNIDNNIDEKLIIEHISMLKGINSIKTFDEERWKEEIVKPQLKLSAEQMKNGECSKPHSTVSELIADLEA